MLTDLNLTRSSAARLRRVTLTCLMSCLSVAGISQAQAEKFYVQDADIDLVDNVYQLNANFDFELSEAVIDALQSGVVLTLTLDIEVSKPRRYLWDKVVASLEQRYELQHHAFSDQYLLHNINSGAHLNFSSLRSALQAIGTVQQLPIIDSHLLEKNIDYVVSIRARLDYSSLPVPLQLKAYISDDWDLESDWYSLLIRASSQP